MSQTTTYADIAAGLIGKFGFLGNLVAFAMPDLKITVLIKLTNPDKKIFVDLSASPMKIVVDGPQTTADVQISTEAELFHYILWGKLGFSKAMNESVLLMVIKSGALPDMPVMESPEGKRTGVNPVYEAYLIHIGAGHLLDEKVQLKFPPPPFSVREIKLGTPGRAGVMEKLASATAYVMGFIGGLGMRVYLKFRKPPKFEPPEITYLTFDEVFTPLPPLPDKPRNKTAAAIMNFMFSRMDIVNVMEAGVSGLKASGALKKPIQLMPPLSQIMREQLKMGT